MGACTQAPRSAEGFEREVRGTFAALVVPIIAVVAGLLAAQVPEPPAAGLVWEAPGGCPGRRELVAAIEQRLGRAFAGEVEVEARVALHAEAPRYRLALRIAARGRGAVRTLTSQRCAALVDATALLVASAAKREAAATGTEAGTESPAEVGGVTEGASSDAAGASSGAAGASSGAAGASSGAAGASSGAAGASSGAETGAATTSSGAGTASPGVESVGPPVWAGAEAAELAGTAPTATSAESPLQPPAGPARRLGGLLRIQGGAELGALPGVSGAIMLAGGLLWRRARLELRGAFLTPRTEVRAEGSLRAFAGMAAVLGCARLGGRRVEFPLCGGLEAGGVRGVAQDVVGARAVTGRWLAVVASAGVAVVVHPRVRLGAALEGVAGLLVPRFEVRDPGPPAGLFASSRVSGRLMLTAELRFRDPR